MVELNENNRQTELINRINVLAHKQKETGLNPEEKQEQAALRKEYLANFRKGFQDQILHTKLYNKKGQEITPAPVREIQKNQGWRQD